MHATAFSRRLVKTFGKQRAKQIVKPMKSKRFQQVAKYGGAFIVITTVAKVVVFGGAVVWGILAVAS